jgi:uncharacterized protein involved in cysteine biosynthesis
MNINFKNPESKEINVVVNVGNGLVVEAGRKVALYLGSERSFIVVVLIGVVVGIVGLLVPLFGIPVTVQAAVLSVGYHRWEQRKVKDFPIAFSAAR